MGKAEPNNWSGVGSDDAKLLSDVLWRVIDKGDEDGPAIAELTRIRHEIDVSKRPEWESVERQQAELYKGHIEASERERDKPPEHETSP